MMNLINLWPLMFLFISLQSNVGALTRLNTDDAKSIIKQIKNLKESLPQNSSNKFIVVFDFDGTILDGDITNGLSLKGEQYKGLAEMAIKSGIVDKFQGEQGFQKYETIRTYFANNHLEKARINFISSVFAPLSSSSDIHLLRPLWKYAGEKILSHYIYKAADKIIRALEEEAIDIQIISASPQAFVEVATHFLPLKMKNIHGLSLVDNILNTGEGKTLRLKKIYHSYKDQGFKPIILAGFGNSKKSDGDFLRFISNHGGYAYFVNGEESMDWDHPNLFEIQLIKRKHFQ